jgi:hypothetical protein
MNEEVSVKSHDAKHALFVLREYIQQGGNTRGIDMEAVERFEQALSWADRIVIEKED